MAYNFLEDENEKKSKKSKSKTKLKTKTFLKGLYNENDEKLLIQKTKKLKQINKKINVKSIDIKRKQKVNMIELPTSLEKNKPDVIPPKDITMKNISTTTNIIPPSNSSLYKHEDSESLTVSNGSISNGNISNSNNLPISKSNSNSHRARSPLETINDIVKSSTLSDSKLNKNNVHLISKQYNFKQKDIKVETHHENEPDMKTDNKFENKRFPADNLTYHTDKRIQVASSSTSSSSSSIAHTTKTQIPNITPTFSSNSNPEKSSPTPKQTSKEIFDQILSEIKTLESINEHEKPKQLELIKESLAKLSNNEKKIIVKETQNSNNQNKAQENNKTNQYPSPNISISSDPDHDIVYKKHNTPPSFPKTMLKTTTILSPSSDHDIAYKKHLTAPSFPKPLLKRTPSPSPYDKRIKTSKHHDSPQPQTTSPMKINPSNNDIIDKDYSHRRFNTFDDHVRNSLEVRPRVTKDLTSSSRSYRLSSHDRHSSKHSSRHSSRHPPEHSSGYSYKSSSRSSRPRPEDRRSRKRPIDSKDDIRDGGEIRRKKRNLADLIGFPHRR